MCVCGGGRGYLDLLLMLYENELIELVEGGKGKSVVTRKKERGEVRGHMEEYACCTQT